MSKYFRNLMAVVALGGMWGAGSVLSTPAAAGTACVCVNNVCVCIVIK